MTDQKLVDELEKALRDEAYDGGFGYMGDERFPAYVRTLAEAAAEVVEKAHTPTDDERKLARAMARVEQLSDHLGIPYVYETGHGPVRPSTAPPVYLAADLWDALGAPTQDFDAYYERNRWADTWSNLLGIVRDRFRPKCGADTEGEPCVLTAGHLPPHYGSSDVGSHEPVPVAEPQGEPSDAEVCEILRQALRERGEGSVYSDTLSRYLARALRAAGGEGR